MSDARLVKVALPTKLVSEMDQLITKSGAYAGRTEFVTDAVANLIADLRASSTGSIEIASTDTATSSHAMREANPTGATVQPPSPESTFHTSPPSRDEALRLAKVRPPSPSTPTLTIDDQASLGGASEPTWGMHNRDWPTVWAASVLGRLTEEGPVEYDQYLEQLLEDAGSIVTSLKDEWDLSGFPSVGSKAAQSQARFIEFFVGGELGGAGPLFSFGLAAPKGSSGVLLTDQGAELLQGLAGMTTERASTFKSTWRVIFLKHLSRHAPADVQMLREVVEHIADGDATRLELISAVARSHPEWPKGTVETNAAGYVARAREWRLLAQKQVNHKYVVEPDGAEDLGQLEIADAGGVQ